MTAEHEAVSEDGNFYSTQCGFWGAGHPEARPHTRRTETTALCAYATSAGAPGITPHDPRRTCTKLCRSAGGEPEQIQLLLGHAPSRLAAAPLRVQQVLSPSRAHRVIMGAATPNPRIGAPQP